MSKACQVCGGLIFASNESAGYGGPLCNGIHMQPAIQMNDGSTQLRVYELEKKVAELEKLVKAEQPNLQESEK